MVVGERPVVEEPRLAVRRRSSGVWSRRSLLLFFLPALATVLTGLTALAVSGNLLLPFESVVVLEGKVASKRDFFEDEEVQRILLKHRVKVHITSSGSREVALRDLADFDFVFPSGQPAGDLITGVRASAGQYAKVHRPFVSPIVLATYREYAETLQDAGIATPLPAEGADRPLYYSLDMQQFLDNIDRGQRWNDLGIRRHGISNANQIVTQSPDVCSSNSASTYLALVSFTWRGDGPDVPGTTQEATSRANSIKHLMEQGLPAADVFRTYVSPEGKGIAPVIVAYEHQYLTYQVQHRAESDRLDSERVLLYPSTQFITQPQFIALNTKGEQLGDLIVKDPELRRRAMELGFRILDPAGEVAGDQLSRFLNERNVPVPALRGDDTHSPMPRIRPLEQMISIIGDCPPAPLPDGAP
ncbi:hypothetical protein OG429_02920 [Streptomyces sp. NBC_00190]|uniref:hypothetical protein n=1 Tax=unclassified Streptomyces TaxID=2593676 RepID=UPI002E2A2030|nr:hypothetical protein [Streptomyces sp. NBC_00190]WSZ38363.1 hypothetical protein OG239_05930 [Streptomyces sp. NBC_00868]